MKSTRIAYAGLAALTAAAIGCQSGTAENPRTYPTTGTVTLNGEPVEGATVSYVPQGEGQTAVGVTNAAGKYELTTFAKGDGALPGSYQVKVVKFEGAESEPVTGEAAPGAIEGDESYVPPDDGAAPAPVSTNQLPEKYADPVQSGLTATISEGENAPQDFSLED